MVRLAHREFCVEPYHVPDTDIDECSIGSDSCSSDATCTDTDASFLCTCETGFTGDGVTCNGQ